LSDLNEYKLRYMDLAFDDMAVIERYLSGFYPGTWPRFSQTLEEEVSRLSSHPYIGALYKPGRMGEQQTQSATSPDSDYRWIMAEDYLVFYKVNETEKRVYIHRILHGARDIQQYLSS